ncbi:MAG: Fe-S cluster assembly protein SufD [Candidatus Symbiothrix sp.]|jgi:Fe-S cluster assembly protein SufD|nr:Fe-S cluster assembly protein SufD [Candidatus Symbiothrix sp.]
MTQYTDFFQKHRTEIDKRCTPLLNAYREKAYETLQQQGLPSFESENYRHTDIAQLLSPDFGFYLTDAIALQPRKVSPCFISNMSAYSFFTVNAWFYRENNAPELPKGVFVGSLNDFSKQYPEKFTQYYNRQAEEKGKGLAAFNTLFVQDGFVLYVPENVRLEKPVQLTQIGGGQINSLINRRLLVILEQNAQAQLLICDHTTDDSAVFAATQNAEIYVAENAVFDLYELEETSGKTIRLANCWVEQARSSQANIYNITLGNGQTRNNYQIDLKGEHAEAHLYGMAISDNRQKIDNFTKINHLVPNCRSNELFKYVLDDEATGIFSGSIVVSPDAQKTEAYQNNRNLLSGNDCRMYSKPQLEIYADDVKCSHGMTTGQLDETALFYMRSRGIPKNEAVLLLKYAFTADVLQGVRIESLRDRLKLLVEKRFRGELATCRNCI